MARAVAGETVSALAAQAGVDGQGAMLWDGERAGRFQFDASDLSALVSADPLQAVYIAPGGTGAAGAWVRQYDGALDIRWFGALGDNATDDSDAFDAAFRLAEALAVTASTNPTIYRGGPVISVGPGRYYCSRTWEPLATVRIQGAGGLGWGAATQVRFAAGITGVRAQAHNTSGVGTVDGPHFSGDALVVQDIYFLGGYVATEGEYHGFHAKRPVHIERCTFDNFEGDGFYANANFAAVDATAGNINVARIINCTFTDCRNGISLEGDDANACAIAFCSFISNRRWGIKEDSFLGNEYFGHHFDENGIGAWNTGAAGHPVSYVFNNGHVFFAIHGQETGASTNSPPATATDNTWWGYYKDIGAATAAYPQWTNGMSVRSGGPLLINGASNASTIYGSHSESNGVSQVDQYGYVAAGTTMGTAVAKVTTGTLSRNRVASLYPIIGGIGVGGYLNISGDLQAGSANNFLGPISGATVQDGVTTFASRSSQHVLQAQIFDSAGVPAATYASLGFYSGLGTILDTAGARIHRFRIGGADMAQVVATGLELPTGKVLTVNGTQVVGAQGAAVAADATDLATAITLVNQLKARLRAHGLIA